MDAHRTYVTGPASNGWQRESLRRYQAGCHDCDWRGPWHGGGSDDGPCGEAARAVARRDADEHAGAGADFDPWLDDPDRDRQYRLENHGGAVASGVLWLGCLLGIALVLAWAAVGGAR